MIWKYFFIPGSGSGFEPLMSFLTLISITQILDNKIDKSWYYLDHNNVHPNEDASCWIMEVEAILLD